jgi:hypothetical protein
MHYRLQRAIEEAIKELTTCEQSYYSASKLKVDRELAEKILAEWISTFPCKYYLETVESELLPEVYISDVLDSVDP